MAQCEVGEVVYLCGPKEIPKSKKKKKSSLKPGTGQKIAETARKRIVDKGKKYAVTEAPVSPLKGLSGNKTPEKTELSWLKDKNKCNQFVGDVLTEAGVKAPTHKMPDGTLHYQRAEQWPERHDLFERVEPCDIAPGDVIVVDNPGSGESTAHVEVITGTNPFSSAGAHGDGAYETTTYDPTNFDAEYDGCSERWIGQDGRNYYVLRPLRAH